MKETIGNKLIAEFMKFTPDYLEVRKSFTSGGLKYHSSWDWLMPVVEKILSPEMYYEFDNCKNPIYMTAKRSHVKASLMTANISEVHEAVIEFIKIYNKQTKEVPMK